jgi:hypothetical protein
MARLLGGSALTHLRIYGGRGTFLDAPAAALLADALRANTTLTSLGLENVPLWDDDTATTTLMGALTGHPSLRALSFFRTYMHAGDHSAAASAAFGALLAANAPALTELDISYSGMIRDAGSRPLLEALSRNTHLRTLYCRSLFHYDPTEEFARGLLLPAVRANRSLRALDAVDSTESRASQEAMRLVRGRT